MNVKDVMAEVERIRALSDDPEAAHGAEDALRASVLQSLADWDRSLDEAKAVAYAALQTQSITFERWCA